MLGILAHIITNIWLVTANAKYSGTHPAANNLRVIKNLLFTAMAFSVTSGVFLHDRFLMGCGLICCAVWTAWIAMLQPEATKEHHRLETERFKQLEQEQQDFNKQLQEDEEGVWERLAEAYAPPDEEELVGGRRRWISEGVVR